MTLFEMMIIQFPHLSRKEIYTRIMCGEVYVDGTKDVNPKDLIRKNSHIEIAGRKYVSRGGLKLEKALREWNIDCKGKVFLDAGSSTGGFTDCLLQNGATAVHSVDVGYNQLAFSIRENPCVYVHEKTNIMDISSLNPVPDAGVADLSFRSINGAASRIIDLVREKWLIALIKPQFEVEKGKFPDFKGVITDKSVLYQTLCSTADRLSEEGLFVSNVTLSPVKGRRGNNEFLFLIDENKRSHSKIKNEIQKIIASIE